MLFRDTLADAKSCQQAVDIKHSQWHSWINEGLMVRGVRIGRRCVRYPRNEVQAVIDARIAGASDEEIKALVVKLHAERQRGLQ